MKYILLSNRIIHIPLFERLKKLYLFDEWILIQEKSKFTAEELERIKPDLIFIPHWSYIIPEDIFKPYHCVVFHMTDLPYGRGGSPLQNLIIRKHRVTKLSAIRVETGIDTGAVYIKHDLSLVGTAKQIMERASDAIYDMIIQLIEEKPIPRPQVGEVTIFKRRTPEDGNLNHITSLEDIYDYIRMLDGEGYPNAFIEFKEFKLEFYNASFDSTNKIVANVRITKK